METKESVLQDCTVHGTVVKLPNGQLERKLYQEVAKALELIGGNWKGGKIAGFVFDQDPTELLQQIANGDQRNLKKEYQFFSTPKEIADWLVQMAEVKPEHRILEPSAGTGSILKSVLDVLPEKRRIDCCELMPTNKTILKRDFDQTKVIFMADDFLTFNNAKEYYHRIIANPPFSKNQDIDHIRHMYELLAPGGRLVSIASKHWELSTNKKETEFRQWIDEIGADIHNIEPGSFKESGTMVGMNVLVIDKPLPQKQPAQLSKPSNILKNLSPQEILDRHATINHLSSKDRIINNIQNLIDEATQKPLIHKGSKSETSFSEWIKDAKNPKQIAENTAEFIRLSDTKQTGVNDEDRIEFRDNSTGAIYTVPDATALPGILQRIKQTWGDGLSHPPIGRVPDNYGKIIREKLQLAVKEKREKVESNPEEREKFMKWLKKCNTGDIFYQCRNYILFTNSPKELPVPAPASSASKTETVPIPAPLPKASNPSDQKKEQHKPIPRKAPLPTQITIVEYSEKAIAVFGNTKPLKDKLSELHGSFCRHLKFQNEPTPGWVFSKKRESAVRQLIAS